MSEPTTDLTTLTPPPPSDAAHLAPEQAAPGDTHPRVATVQPDERSQPRPALTPAMAPAEPQPVRLPAYLSDGPATGPTSATSIPGASTASSLSRRRRRLADSGRIPALRFNRRDHSKPAQEAKPAITYDTRAVPGYLRLLRLVLGLVMLAVAWGGSLLVVMLAESLAQGFPHQPSLTERFALYLIAAIGILWLGVLTLALILAGAYSLALALTRRGW